MMKQKIKNLSSLLQGTSRKVAWAVVPSVVVMLMALALSGCVKQKNCDGGVTGKFVYLKEPYEEYNVQCSKTGKVVAHFFTGGAHDYAIHLSGYIPIKFRSADTVEVTVYYETPCRPVLPVVGTYYDLKCIERR